GRRGAGGFGKAVSGEGAGRAPQGRRGCGRNGGRISGEPAKTPAPRGDGALRLAGEGARGTETATAHRGCGCARPVDTSWRARGDVPAVSGGRGRANGGGEAEGHCAGQ